MVYSWSTWFSQQLYKVSTKSEKNIKFSVKTVWHCCDLEIPSRSLKVVWKGKAQSVLPACKFDIYHIYSVRENSNVKVFATKVQSASLTLVITEIHFSRELKNNNKQAKSEAQACSWLTLRIGKQTLSSNPRLFPNLDNWPWLWKVVRRCKTPHSAHSSAFWSSLSLTPAYTTASNTGKRW